MKYILAISMCLSILLVTIVQAQDTTSKKSEKESYVIIEVKEYPNLPVLGVSFLGVILVAKGWTDYSHNKDMEGMYHDLANDQESWELEQAYRKRAEDFSDKVTTAQWNIIIGGTVALVATTIALRPRTRKVEVQPILLTKGSVGMQLIYNF